MSDIDVFEVTNETLPLLRVGTYWGVFGPDRLDREVEYMAEADIIDDDGDKVEVDAEELKEMYDLEFCFGLYTAALAKTAGEYIREAILPELKKLELGITDIWHSGINSPKFYNYRDDYINLDLYAEKGLPGRVLDRLAGLKGRDPELLEKWLRKNFSSYDGFLSFIANNTRDLRASLENWKDGSERELCAALTWLLLQNGYYPDTHTWNLYYRFEEEYADPLEFLKPGSLFVDKINWLDRRRADMLEALTDRINARRSGLSPVSILMVRDYTTRGIYDGDVILKGLDAEYPLLSKFNVEGS
jgi:hypothetical protein